MNVKSHSKLEGYVVSADAAAILHSLLKAYESALIKQPFDRKPGEFPFFGPPAARLL